MTTGKLVNADGPEFECEVYDLTLKPGPHSSTAFFRAHAPFDGRLMNRLTKKQTNFVLAVGGDRYDFRLMGPGNVWWGQATPAT